MFERSLGRAEGTRIPQWLAPWVCGKQLCPAVTRAALRLVAACKGPDLVSCSLHSTSSGRQLVQCQRETTRRVPVGDNWYRANGRQLVQRQWETNGTVPVGDNWYSASGRRLVQFQWEANGTVPVEDKLYSSREYAREPAPLTYPPTSLR